MWIAREENDDLYLFRYKPYKSVRHWLLMNKIRLNIVLE